MSLSTQHTVGVQNFWVAACGLEVPSGSQCVEEMPNQALKNCRTLKTFPQNTFLLLRALNPVP